MDTLLVRRNLANEKNTAQKGVDDHIQRAHLGPRESEFVLPVMPLAGPVNFAALKSLNVVSIVNKEPAEITEAFGFPPGLTNLCMTGQLLTEFLQAPAKLVSLNLDRNHLEKIDLSKCEYLKVLSLKGNRLKSLGALPVSLEEIYVDDNQISRMNLTGLERLRILHCRNNRTIRIDGIPASMVDLQVEEGNPLITLDYDFVPGNAGVQEDNRARGTEAEYVEALHEYFRLKTKYEEAAKIARSKVREAALMRGLGKTAAIKRAIAVIPKCVICKRPVGSTFKTKDDRLLAYCGDRNNPCGFRIEIFRGQFEHDDRFAAYTEQQWLETKEQIIQQKMDVLFNYVSEESAVQKFKDLIEDYNLFSVLHKTDLDIREDKRFNIHKKELIKGKQALLEELRASIHTHMEEYAESGNRDSLHTAMDIYSREYLPETRNLRLLKYEVMEMVVPPGEFADSPVRALNQNAAALKRLETLHGEVPRVLKFSVAPEQDTSVSKDLVADDVLMSESESEEEPDVDVDVVEPSMDEDLID